jgi:hypothetical protein
MTEIRKSKQYLVMEGLGHLILEFVILDTNLQGRAIISDPRNAGQAWPIEDPAMRGRTRFSM